MKTKYCFGALLFLLCGCSDTVSSLGGGQLIEESIFVPPVSSSMSDRGSLDTAHVLDDCFIGTFYGEDDISGVSTDLIVDEEGNAVFENEWEDRFEFSFIRQQQGSLNSYTAYFEDDAENTMVLEQGASFLFVTVNGGEILENSCCVYDSTAFSRR